MTKRKTLIILLAALTLTACKIDMTVTSPNTTDSVVSLGDSAFNCTAAGGDCTQTYKPVGACTAGDANCTEVGGSGQTEIVAANPSNGSNFAGWGGVCLYGAGVCHFTVDADTASTDNNVNIDANFEADAAPQDATYTYNYKGQRDSKTVGNVTTFFVYDLNDHLIGEYTQEMVGGVATPKPIREYVWIEDQLLAQYDYSASATNPKLNYYINDHLGTPVYMVDENRNITYDLEQGPFGERNGEYKVTGTTQPIGFSNQYRDVESGYSDNGFRTFAGDRYLQSDPIGLNGGVNTYGYVEQNPVMYVDLDGRKITYGPNMLHNTRVYGLVLSQIAKLKRTQEGARLVDQLDNSEHVFIIEYSVGKASVDNSVLKDNNCRNDVGAGATLNYDPARSLPGYLLEDGKDYMGFVNLGHEFEHLSEIDRGKMDTSRLPDDPYGSHERRAVDSENKIRNEAGLTRRLGYGPLDL